VSLATSSFLALNWKMSRLGHYRGVPADVQGCFGDSPKTCQGQRREQPTQDSTPRGHPSLWKSPRQLRCRIRIVGHLLPTPIPRRSSATAACHPGLRQAH
jgi:hypothetical protein